MILDPFILPHFVKLPKDYSEVYELFFFRIKLFFFSAENHLVNRFVFKYSLVCFPVTCCLVPLTKCPEAQSSHPFVRGVYLIIYLRAKMLQL